jgi:hypothetical protein
MRLSCFSGSSMTWVRAAARPDGLYAALVDLYVRRGQSPGCAKTRVALTSPPSLPNTSR